MTTLGKHVLQVLHRNVGRISVKYSRQANLHTSSPYYLFSSDILGIEGFKRQRSQIQEKLGGFKEKFRGRMEEYMGSDTRNTIFTDDLKTIIHVAETDEDIETLEKMLKRFNMQSEELRFSNFVFGPVVMRLYHMLNKPERAFNLFQHEDLSGLFDQMSSYITLMDMLFEGGMYSEVLATMDIVSNKKLAGIQYPGDCVTLASAACFKLNTSESFTKAQLLLQNCVKAGSTLPLRACVYTAMLALKQDSPETALEVLSAVENIRNKFLIAYNNVKALTYAALGRDEDALSVLRTVLEQDVPEHVVRGNEIFASVMKTVELSINKESKEGEELHRQFSIIKAALEKGNHVTDTDFEEYLFRDIVRKRQLQDGYKSRQRAHVGGYSSRGGRRSYRPGLREGEEQFSL